MGKSALLFDFIKAYGVDGIEDYLEEGDLLRLQNAGEERGERWEIRQQRTDGRGQRSEVRGQKHFVQFWTIDSLTTGHCTSERGLRMNGMLRDDRVVKIARWHVQLYISSTEISSSLYCNGLLEFRVLLLSRGGYMKGKFLGSFFISRIRELVD